MISTFDPVFGHTIGMPLAIPYVRYSTPKQEAGSSRDRQHELITAMAKQHGWTLGRPVEDLGRSAWKGDHIRRGKLGRWSDAIRRGEVPAGTILVVEKIDRLSRQGFDVLNDWMREMISHGIRIATVEDGKVYDAETRRDLGSYINRLLKAEGAYEYVDTMRGRVIDAIRKRQEARIADKTPQSAVHPKWLRYDDEKRLEPIPARAAAVQSIYQMAADGLGAMTIARRLNDSGVECWTAPRWLPTTIRHLLRHPSVDGTYQPMEFGKPMGDPITDFYPAIVDNDLIRRARTCQKSRKGAKSGGDAFINLFQGLTRCGVCMGRVHVQKSKDQKTGAVRRFFRCYNGAHRAGCDRTVMFRYQELEDAVLDRLLHLALDDRFFVRVDATRPLAIAVADLEKRLEVERAQSERLLTLILSTDDPDPLMLKRRDTLIRTIAVTEAELARMLNDLATAKGHVDQTAHLQRVNEVREKVRQGNERIAREVVASAFRGLISSVVFDVENGERTITVIIAGGIAAMKFHNNGHLIDQRDLSPEIDARLRSGVVGADPVWNTNLNAFLRRAA